MSSAEGGVNRRDFLVRGLAHAAERAAAAIGDRIASVRHVRPPGALPEAGFIAACTRCGECASACPVNAISLLGESAGIARGTPVLHPELTACIMCPDMPCSAHCPTSALAVPEDGWRSVRMAWITIDEDRCIAHRDVACGVCARVCPVGERALSLDQLGRPVVGAACTGCGICVTACVTEPGSIHASAGPARA
ncbi:MAG: 4Fe-4S dicluster domain-containing protein [Gemmatimonadaceae bacterium]